jgi:hypothetical protein
MIQSGQLSVEVPIMPILVVMESVAYVQADSRSQQTVNAMRKLLLTVEQIAAICSVKNSLRTSTASFAHDLFVVQRIETWLYRITQRISHQRCILHNQTAVCSSLRPCETGRN